ncbi:MAG: hypothetical protein AABX23_03540 [Nanoarchaeota archaeon]
MTIVRVTDLVESVLNGKNKKNYEKEINDFIKYHQERGGNQFVKDYISEIVRSRKMKKDIVSENPELAQRIFQLFRDTEIGEMFVKKYAEGEYHHTAYFISLEIRQPIDRHPVVL